VARSAPTAIALTAAALAGLAVASSAAGLSVSDTIAVGTSPNDIAFRGDGQRAYVSNSGGNGVSVIDTATRTVSSTISVPGPSSVASGGTRLAMGSNAGGGQYRASFYDNQTNNFLGNGTLGGQLGGVAMAPDGSFAYLATSVTITKVNAASQAIAAQSAQAQVSYNRVVMRPSAGQVWATSYNAGTLTVFGTSALATTQTISQFGNFGVVGLAITPDEGTVYVTKCSTGVIPVNASTYAVGSTIPLAGCPYGVAIDPTGKVAFVSRNSANTVSAIDMLTHEVIAEAPVGQSPGFLAVNPQGGELYVVNNASNTVSVIPFGTPAAPAAPTATAGDARATVSWAAPAQDGGFPITTYLVEAVQDPSRNCTVTAPATSCEITGLTNGVARTFTVKATNVLGASAASGASGAVTPTGLAPSPSGQGTTPAPSPSPTPAAAPAMSARLLVSRSRVVSGQQVRMAIRARNTGTGASGATTACVQLPRQLVVAWAPGATRVGRALCFRLGAMAPGTSATRQFTARAVALRPGVARVTASARAAGTPRMWAKPAVIRIAPRAARTPVTE
jgi:YVTN family beta-propeller protein